METKKSEKVNFDFEKALKRLEDINGELSNSDTGLDKSIKLYSEGMELVKKCRQVLDGAKKRMDEATACEAQGESGDTGE